MNTVTRGNLLGIGALIMWSSMVAVIRSVTEAFGVQAGTALIYTVGAIATLTKNGMPPVKKIPRIYLFVAGALFILYEIVYTQASGRAESASQTTDVGILKYLWPCSRGVFSLRLYKTT